MLVLPCDSFFNSVAIVFDGCSKRSPNLPVQKVLSLLLLASALSLGVGGLLLYAYSLVPDILVATTAVAVIILLILSVFVWRQNMLSINISTALGLFAPILSYSTPAHVGVLEQIGRGGLISILGILQLAGFYIFPITYVVLRVIFSRKLTKQIDQKPFVHLE